MWGGGRRRGQGRGSIKPEVAEQKLRQRQTGEAQVQKKEEGSGKEELWGESGAGVRQTLGETRIRTRGFAAL